jgi:chemotaxis protein CheD
MTLSEDASYSSPRITHVRIGELRTAASGILKATLGSCVAIALMDRREGVCGLAHCFLPFAPEEYSGRDARYADRAAANLLQKVAPDAFVPRKLRAFIAGGGRLLSQEVSSRLQVGTANVEAARAGLRELGIRFKEVEIGGVEGCNAILDCDRFTFTCEKISNMLIGDKE